MKENEIRPDQFQDRIDRLARRDKQYLLDRLQRFVAVSCPACGADEGDFRFEKFETNYLQCPGCRTVYASPRPNSSLLAEYYQQSQNYAFWYEHVFPATEETRRKSIFRPRAQLVADFVQRYGVKGGTLLEIGAGFGTFGQEMMALGTFDRIIALELTPTLAGKCRDRGLEVMECSVEEVSLAGIQADVVVSFETLEHLFDPLAVLRSCCRVLNPGGILMLTCPNMLGLDTMTLGERSSSVGGEHLNLLNPRSLEVLLARAGFEVLEVKTPGKLDVELLRKKVLTGDFDLDGQPFLAEILLERFDELAGPFQEFLAANKLSSHMMAIARKSGTNEGPGNQ